MRQHAFSLSLLAVAVAACAAATPMSTAGGPMPADDRRPLTDQERARLAIDRLTFGGRPGDVAAVERMGAKAWIERQLRPDEIADPRADSVLSQLEITHKSSFELVADHPQANEYGFIGAVVPDTAEVRRKGMGDSANAPMDPMMLNAKVAETAIRATQMPILSRMRNGAVRELQPSILIRSVTSDRQLLEVMTGFWENHFSVSIDKILNPFSLVDYDHGIHAHALGKFRDLLEVVATSPAMLYYLDNYSSTVDSLHPNPVEWQIEERRRAHPPLGDTSLARTLKRRRTGVNENYARELMELHTLGVDGGYTQADVQEVARCLTGWGIDNIQYGGNFAFHRDQHDAGEKVVLGVHIAAGRGIEDGEQVLDILARNPATARFIARKLVVHFVSDSAPPALVERAATTYLRTDGDIREVMRTILTSPEFNSRQAYRAKIKTPFELVASTLRVMNAAPDTTQRSVQILTKLGQPIFGRSTPDGWPDKADAWMNAGALLNRVNLGTQVASNQVPNIVMSRWKPMVDLTALPQEKVVDGVITAVLGGEASAVTRTALLEIQPSPGLTGDAQRQAYIGALVAVALGSADFQRR